MVPLPVSNTSDSGIIARAKIQDGFYWTALGDSFAAGPGAGEKVREHHDSTRECSATEGSYPAQLRDLPFPGEEIQFLACTGDVTNDVIESQIPKWDHEHKQGLVTLSIGGNDALFSSILKACVFRPLGALSPNCDKTLQEAEDIIFGDLGGRIIAVYRAIEAALDWSAAPIYHTLYDNFFNEHTEWCNDQTMGIVYPKPPLTKELRSKLNFLTQKVNAEIANAATKWNNRGGGGQIPIPNRKSPIYLVQPNDRFDGHRFCEEGVKDFTDDSVWFFSLSFTGKGQPATVEDFKDVNIETCADDIRVQNDLGRAIKCDLAKYYDQASEDEKKNITVVTGGITQVFHPKIPGFTAIRDEVLEQMRLTGMPVHLNLKVLPLGDSITWGFGSSSGNGYRGPLNVILKRGNNVVDFIGSQKSGDMDDNDNEGHPGYTISQIAEEVRKGNLQRAAEGQNPNVVLLHAGTNDMNIPTDPDTAHLRLGALIDQLFEEYPDATIIVAQIVPSTNGAVMKRIENYNVRVALEVQARRQKGKHLWFAWMPVAENGLGDAIHPNDYGYKAMAQGWAEALEQAQINKWIKDTAPGGRDECKKLPSWVEQGQVASGAGFGKSQFEGSYCREFADGICDCRRREDDTKYQIEKGSNECRDFTYPGVRAVQFADLNGDGRDEYIWIHKDGAVTAFQNLGHKYVDGKHGVVTWGAMQKIAGGVGGTREEVRFADLNGDGRAEYLRVHPDGSVSAWLNVLEASNDIKNIIWVPQGKIAGGIGLPGAGVRFADLNGDGRAEYLHVSAVGEVTCYLNGGYKYVDSKKGEVVWIPQGVIATGVRDGSTLTNLRFADTNGDGRADYVVVQHIGTGGALLWLNLGGPDNGPNAGKVRWWERGLVATGPGDRVVDHMDVAFADLNGDGRDDYIWVNPDTSAIEMWLNIC
ncbi:hypothetical protein FQN57_002094 [Myotisia sp. PD_48]|nr:hypothetical protein FQN57_002094 [Myotisia sp. PD_48]